ncbi:MAG: glycosyltransferase family 9 protein [Lysobacteraceae bacterium]
MNDTSTATPPRSLCLLRLSALGDVTHVVPLVRRVQAAWPATKLTWVIGRIEHRLLQDLPGIEFIVFDKKDGWRGIQAIRRQLRGRQFDALLNLQIAIRANLLSTAIPAKRRIGYDRARSKDLHGLFINERIAARSGQHVLDALDSFLEPLGLPPRGVAGSSVGAPVWDLPIPDQAHAFAAEHLPGEQPTLLISPCASHPLRNWRAERYAAAADHAAREHGWRVLLCGGRSQQERDMGDAILAAMQQPAIDLIAKDTLPQLLALLQRADLVMTPDSGPTHFANAVGSKVLGLHAASNPDRSGPYSDRHFCVSRYDDAARKFKGKPASELKWGTKIEHPGVMDLITVDDAIAAFERFIESRKG